MKVLVIHNPVSGMHRVENIVQMIKNELTKKKIEFTWFETLPVDKQPFANIINEDYDRVLVVGGDGTVREVASYIFWEKINLSIGIIPIGTSNLLAQALGIPVFSLKKSILFALEKQSKSLDVIEVNREHIGLIAAGIGYDSVFIKGASRQLKRSIGFFAYIWSFLMTFFVYKNNLYKITIGQDRYSMYGKVAMIFNVLPPHAISAKHISPSDGLLNLTVFHPRSIIDFVMGVFLFFFHKNRSINDSLSEFEITQCSIKLKRNKSIQIDGEVFKGKNLQIKIRKKALDFIYEKVSK